MTFRPYCGSITLGAKYFPSDGFGVRLHGRIMTTYLVPNDRIFCASDGTCYRVPETTYMTQIDIAGGVIIPIY